MLERSNSEYGVVTVNGGEGAEGVRLLVVGRQGTGLV